MPTVKSGLSGEQIHHLQAHCNGAYSDSIVLGTLQHGNGFYRDRLERHLKAAADILGYELTPRNGLRERALLETLENRKRVAGAVA